MIEPLNLSDFHPSLTRLIAKALPLFISIDLEQYLEFTYIYLNIALKADKDPLYMSPYSKRFKSNLQISTLLAALLLSPLSTSTNFITTAQAEDKVVPKIHVTGEGKVDLAPDLAVLNLGVMREAKTARSALSENNKAMADVIAAMKEEGIEAKDLQTSNFSIQPRYVYHRPKDGEQQKPPKIVGYTVSNNLTVRIRDLKSIGDILDRSVTLGVNSGGHIQFGNDDPKPAITKARAAAMKDAMERATTLISAAGVSLGRILEINESFNRPHPVPMARGKMMAEASMADSVPIEGGENTYSVNVNVTWEIAQ